MAVVDDVLWTFFTLVQNGKGIGVFYDYILCFSEWKFRILAVEMRVVFSIVYNIQIVPFPWIIPEPDIVNTEFIIRAVLKVCR